jgi:hypothetical protein
MDNQEIIKAETMAADIKVCNGCDRYHSHSRGFAVPDERTIHYSAKGATRKTLYGFLHEIGHIIKGHGKTCKLRRFQREAEAEDYARKSLQDYGISVPRKAVVLGNAYVKRWKRFGDKISKKGN